MRKSVRGFGTQTASNQKAVKTSALRMEIEADDGCRALCLSFCTATLLDIQKPNKMKSVWIEFNSTPSTAPYPVSLRAKTISAGPPRSDTFLLQQSNSAKRFSCSSKRRRNSPPTVSLDLQANPGPPSMRPLLYVFGSCLGPKGTPSALDRCPPHLFGPGYSF